jgi:multiple sugar transport system substrate-binding protein
MLLARAAAYACHPHQEGVLFDAQTMQPRIAEEPFIRAMEEWRQERALATLATETTTNSNVAGDETSDRLVWAELPGSDRTFNRSTAAWDVLPGGSRQVPLLADGWLVAVTTTTRNATSAFDLAAWLASGDISAQLAPAFNTMLPCRRALLSNGRRRAGSPIWTHKPAIAKVVESVMTRGEGLVVPRIPGVDQYLAALSEAVETALRGDQPAITALQVAAQQWDRITDRLGRDGQRRAYLAHLNIAEL